MAADSLTKLGQLHRELLNASATFGTPILNVIALKKQDDVKIVVSKKRNVHDQLVKRSVMEKKQVIYFDYSVYVLLSMCGCVNHSRYFRLKLLLPFPYSVRL